MSSQGNTMIIFEKAILSLNEHKKQIFLAIFLSLILSYAYLYLPSKFPVLQIGHLKTLDAFMNSRYKTSKALEVAKKIVIINIDEDTFRKLKEQWPLNRGFTAYFLEKISTPASQPVAIGLDLVYAGKSDVKEADLWLASAFKKAGNVTIASFFNPDGELALPEQLFINSVKAVGFINSPLDADQTIRRSYPFIFLKDGSLNYSLPLQIFVNLKGYDLKKSSYDPSAKALKLISPVKKMLIPVDNKTYSTRINYMAKPKDFKSIPLWEVLTSLEPASTFKDKIILLGTDMEITRDIYPTPLGAMPGIYINANCLMNMMLDNFLKEIPPHTYFIIFFTLALFVTVVRSNSGIIRSILFLLLILVAAYYLTVNYLAKDIIIDFFGIATVSVLSFLIVSIIEYANVIIENVKLTKLAVTDGLTGLFSFRYFEVRLIKELNISLQLKKDLSLVIFDIDHFKQFNDNHGHEAGNAILKSVAATLRARCRQTDTVCRYGGEEFVSILQNTSLEGAGKYAEAIRKNIEMFVVSWEGKDLKITVSAGVSSLSCLTKKTAPELINSADKALYAAKNAGRNRVSSAEQIK